MSRETRATLVFAAFVIGYLVAAALADAIEQGRWKRFTAAWEAPTVEEWIDV
jgi:hypothetical protein